MSTIQPAFSLPGLWRNRCHHTKAIPLSLQRIDDSLQCLDGLLFPPAAVHEHQGHIVFQIPPRHIVDELHLPGGIRTFRGRILRTDILVMRDIAGQIDRLIEIIAEHADRPPRCTDNQRADSEDIEDDFL